MSSLSPHEISLATVRLIEERVQRDEGNRGLEALLQPSSNELYNAARALITKKSVAIITGFPCLVDFTPPTETDGPLGAVAIAELLLKLGKTVHMLTDECNEEPVLSCVSRSGIYNFARPHKEGLPSRLLLQSFPARTEFDDKDAERLSDILDVIDCVVAIERVGPAADGNCYTMRGISMNHLAAPLELLLINPPETILESESELDVGYSQPRPHAHSCPSYEIPVGVPASVVALERAAQANSAGIASSSNQMSDDERAALLALLESDVELTDEQFEALALLAPPPPPPLGESEDDGEEDEEVKEKEEEEVEIKFETVSHDYSLSGGMTMEEMMAELPPPPKGSLVSTVHSVELTDERSCSVLEIGASFNSNITSIGIGDGGNEVGMGKVLDLMMRSGIPNATTIACVIPTEHLVVASVSNWGGVALVAAMVTILIHESAAIREDSVCLEKAREGGRSASYLETSVDNMMMLNHSGGAIVDTLCGGDDSPLATSVLSSEVLSLLEDRSAAEAFLRRDFLPSRERQLQACVGLIEAGARDGITKECELSVDGMSLETSLRVLDDINDIVISSLSALPHHNT